MKPSSHPGTHKTHPDTLSLIGQKYKGIEKASNLEKLPRHVEFLQLKNSKKKHEWENTTGFKAYTLHVRAQINHSIITHYSVCISRQRQIRLCGAG